MKLTHGGVEHRLRISLGTPRQKHFYVQQAEMLNTYPKDYAVHIEQRHVTMRSLNHTQPPQEIEGLHAKRVELQKRGSH